ncbi:MAG: glycine/sarcosine/betaine reductase complex component C subunit beta [Actinomycetota bacterium]|nr:glycine/sarcosine/betaine reductase complex component C subunit beta [Actinomycetota bacterium]
MSEPAVISATSTILAHAPGLVRHGSKPSRELPKDEELKDRFLASLRSFEDAVAYPPHQAYLGVIHPRELPERPWVESPQEDADRFAPRGELMPETELLGLMAAVDEFELLTLDEDFAEEAAAALSEHPLAKYLKVDRISEAVGDVEAKLDQPGALPLHIERDRVVGAIRRAHDKDQSLAAHVLLENLACKATGTLALLHLLEDHDIDPSSIEYTLSCSEEAVGDRYQRGGGNMAKSMAGVAGLSEASGFDVKNFCAAPLNALVVAASLVQSGVFQRVAIIGGGSLAKLGMKFQGALEHDLPILEDVMGGNAVLVQADDEASPRVRLDAVGRHRVGAGSSNKQILQDLAVEPLEGVGLGMLDVDDYGTELHNPEIMEPQGSGDPAGRNYKTLAALAAHRGEIEREDIDEFVSQRGMPGFAPDQGHLASALCYMPHAIPRLTDGDAERILLMAKGSLFLGRMSQDSDGMSVLLERNPERR